MKLYAVQWRGRDEVAWRYDSQRDGVPHLYSSYDDADAAAGNLQLKLLYSQPTLPEIRIVAYNLIVEEDES